MSEVHLRGTDLNLLRALDALLVTRHVTRAALSLGVTQSAMSHSLSRLRQLFHDPLLVRGPNGLVATERARLVEPRLREALVQLGTLLEPLRFEPLTAERTFRVATSDYVEIVLLPALHARLAREAPRIDLRFFDAGTNYLEALGEGRFDVAMLPLRPDPGMGGILARRLLDERFVCVVRRGHPLTRGKLTLARFAAASHALIAPRGDDGSFVDDALARLNMARRVAVRVPHFMSAPHLVARSDLVLTLAARVADALADSFGLSILQPPPELALASFTMSLLWHERHGGDPAHAWFREVVADVARGTAPVGPVRRRRRPLP